MSYLGHSLFQQQKQTQVQVLAPQLRQSLKILQVPAHELRKEILEELQINPALEELASTEISLDETSHHLEHLANLKSDATISCDLSSWLKDQAWEVSSLNRLSHDAYDRSEPMFATVTAEVSWQEHILKEARLSGAAEAVLQALSYLLNSLDDNGFLKSTLEHIASDAHQEVFIFEEALQLLKTLEPTGLGAKDIQECLIWQLESSQHPHQAIAIRILKEYYPLFIRRRIGDIAKKLNLPLADAQAAFDCIAQLHPAPGRKFKAEANHWVVPDVVVEKINGRWMVSLPNEYIPRLRLNPIYRDLMLKPELSAQEKTYLKDKIQAGEALIQAIHQRQETIRRIATEMLALQLDFFEKGIQALKPMNMQAIALALSLHETTISRAVHHKYMQTPHGLFEMRSFFTSGYTTDQGESISSKSVQQTIRFLIDTEDKAKPLSDQQIVGLLAAQNIKVARRTVSKYREMMGILPAYMRKLATFSSSDSPYTRN